MKKVLVLVLALVLVMSMAVPAYATRSAGGPEAAPNRTTPLPMTGDDAGCFVPIFRANILEPADRETFMASQAVLRNAVPDGMNATYFFFHNAVHPEHVLIIEAAAVVVKNYVEKDGNMEWVEFPVTDNQDGTFTLVDMPKTPFAIFTK